MSVSLNFFPVLDDLMVNKIGLQPEEYSVSYNSNSGLSELQYDYPEDPSSKSKTIRLRDPKGEWNMEEYGFSMEKKYILRQPSFLFGPNGLALEDAVIGIAVIWYSKTSNQRGISHVGELKKGDIMKDCFFFMKFDKAELRGSVFLETVLYIKKPGMIKAGKNLANEEGTIIGILEKNEIILEGNGSIFPVVEVQDKYKPLWWLEWNAVNPLEDSFDEENVCIYINNIHPDYESLKMEDGLGNSPNLREIISTAIQLIILKIKDGEYWEETIKGDEFEFGSISHAVNYFIKSFDWNANEPEKFAMAIRKDFDQKMRI